MLIDDEERSFAEILTSKEKVLYINSKTESQQARKRILNYTKSQNVVNIEIGCDPVVAGKKDLQLL